MSELLAGSIPRCRRCRVIARQAREAQRPRPRPEYRVWKYMLSRCAAKSGHAFKYYAGRGIRVCDRWRESFDAFFADMGPRPSDKHSIDRIDPDGNYEPSNCRWVTHDVQMKNQRKHKRAA